MVERSSGWCAGDTRHDEESGGSTTGLDASEQSRDVHVRRQAVRGAAWKSARREEDISEEARDRRPAIDGSLYEREQQERAGLGSKSDDTLSRNI
jgi:hypothetical protein